MDGQPRRAGPPVQRALLEPSSGAPPFASLLRFVHPGAPRSHRPVGLALAALLLTLLFAGCLGDGGPREGDGDAHDQRFSGAQRPAFTEGRAVVAIVDTGINPYHLDFRATQRTARALDLLSGYPSDGLVLPLTFDAADHEAALAADDGLWDLVEEGTLYDVPGTRIVGMVAFGEPAAAASAPRAAPGLDEVGHGTASAGMVAAACPSCLLVAVEVAGATEGRAALAWLATQSWVDVIVYPARAGVGFVGAGTHLADSDSEFAWARDNAEAGQVVVVAAGNGWQDATGTGATAYSPARDVSYSYWTAGPDWVVTVGAIDPQTSGASTWHTVPVDVVAQGLDCDAPHPFSLAGRVTFEGTSCSAPIVAGQMGHVLATVRDAAEDGATGPRSAQRLVVPADVRQPVTTREDLTRVFLLTAGRVAGGAAGFVIEDPLRPEAWSTGDSVVAPVHAGWGAHDEATLAEAVAVLLDERAAPPPQDDEAAWFPVDRRLRLGTWGSWDDGESRFAFPAPLAAPVVVPASAAEVTALYEAALARAP